ncbi:FHA domain-containing protein [Lentzea californiensis]|uniref:FHA domain-containing protein n=1 Tax=Lentzea californiensis TaxID=438851 RepID=UPI002164F59B|nr:FHA domain-containing protein [Lentzea californiensis]MCR3753752.1 FHA domain-containing protein [Lentzea californiensis]
MSDVRYVPGSWVAVVGEQAWLLLAVTPESDLVGRCWDLVRTDHSLEEVLATIMHEGFRAVSGFALVRLAAEERRAVVRGEARLEVVHESGAAEEINAVGVGTWVDRNLADVAGLRLKAGPGGPELPLQGGVVLASELVVALSGAVELAPRPVSRPAPPAAVDQIVVQHEEPVDVTIVRDQVPPPLWPAPQPRTTQQAGVIQSFDWAPPVAVAQVEPSRQSEAVTETQLRTNDLAPDHTRMMHGGRTSGPRMARAKKCHAGHLSSEHVTYCRVCEDPLPDQIAAMMPVPVLGVLRLSNGDTIPLDRNVVLGRDPQGDRGSVNLVQIGGEIGTEISRTHVEVRLEDWDVLVCDLGSMNGTSVSRPGCPPEKLAAHIADVLYPGTRVLLGDQFSFTFEVTG